MLFIRYFTGFITIKNLTTVLASLGHESCSEEFPESKKLKLNHAMALDVYNISEERKSENTITPIQLLSNRNRQQGKNNSNHAHQSTYYTHETKTKRSYSYIYPVPSANLSLFKAIEDVSKAHISSTLYNEQVTFNSEMIRLLNYHEDLSRLFDDHVYMTSAQFRVSYDITWKPRDKNHVCLSKFGDHPSFVDICKYIYFLELMLHRMAQRYGNVF